MFFPVERVKRGGNTRVLFDFFRFMIECRGAVLHAPQPLRRAGGKKHRFTQRSLSAPALTEKSYVTQFFNFADWHNGIFPPGLFLCPRFHLMERIPFVNDA